MFEGGAASERRSTEARIQRRAHRGSGSRQHSTLCPAFVLTALIVLSCWPTPQPPAVDPSEFAVAAYGDSLTLGGGTGPGGWPSALPVSWTHFNSGKNAERAKSGAARPVSAPDLGVLASNWDVVVLMWGTNDVTYPGYSDDLGSPTPDWPAQDVLRDEDVLGPIEGAAMTLQAAGLRVVVAWPPPLLIGASGAEIGNARLLRLRDAGRTRFGAHGIAFVDLFAAFSESPSVPDPSIYYQDPVHWNALGNQRAADRSCSSCNKDFHRWNS